MGHTLLSCFGISWRGCDDCRAVDATPVACRDSCAGGVVHSRRRSRHVGGRNFVLASPHVGFAAVCAADVIRRSNAAWRAGGIAGSGAAGVGVADCLMAGWRANCFCRWMRRWNRQCRRRNWQTNYCWMFRCFIRRRGWSGLRRMTSCTSATCWRFHRGAMNHGTLPLPARRWSASCWPSRRMIRPRWKTFCGRAATTSAPIPHARCRAVLVNRRFGRRQRGSASRPARWRQSRQSAPSNSSNGSAACCRENRHPRLPGSRRRARRRHPENKPRLARLAACMIGSIASSMPYPNPCSMRGCASWTGLAGCCRPIPTRDCGLPYPCGRLERAAGRILARN